MDQFTSSKADPGFAASKHNQSVASQLQRSEANNTPTQRAGKQNRPPSSFQAISARNA